MSDAGPDGKELAYAIEKDPKLRLLIPLVVAFAFLMEELDSTVIVTAIPKMAIDLHSTALQLSLAVTVYVLTLAVFIPVSGWFADRFGARRIFILALLIFTASSALCGATTSLAALVGMRCIQGLGGAMMTPVGRLILLRSFPRSQLITAMLYMTMPAMIGPVIGPLLGGFFTSYLSWRWIFYINVPFGLLGAILALKFVRVVPAPRPAAFDVAGFLIAGAGLLLVQFGIENFTHPLFGPVVSVASLVLGPVLLAMFVRHARRHPSPSMDLSLFRLRTFRIAALAGGICRIGINGMAFLMPLMLQLGLGLTPAQSGSLTFLMTLGSLLVRPVSRGLLRNLGFARLLVLSALLGSGLIAGFWFIGPLTPHAVIALYIVAYGLVRSVQFLSSNTLSYSEMPSEKLSRATSLGGVIQHLSLSFGVAIAALLLRLVSQSEPSHLTDFHHAALLLALIPLVAIPGFFFLQPGDGFAVSGHKPRRRNA